MGQAFDGGWTPEPPPWQSSGSRTPTRAAGIGAGMSNFFNSRMLQSRRGRAASAERQHQQWPPAESSTSAFLLQKPQELAASSTGSAGEAADPAAPDAGDAGEAQASTSGRFQSRRKQVLEGLRRRRAEALSHRDEAKVAAQAVERKPQATMVSEERTWVRPLLLGVSSVSRRLSLQLHALLWHGLRFFADAEAWLEPMFFGSPEESASLLDDGPSAPLGADGVTPDWRPAEDGLFRSSNGVHHTEPWNRERLHVQFERALLSQPAAPGQLSTAVQEVEDVRADEDRETLACSLCAPRLVSDGAALRARSHVKSKRRHLVASHLYELRLDVTRITLFQTPLSGDVGKRSAIEALYSVEGKAAAELQELFQSYRQESEGDMVSHLDNRLNALVEHGMALRKAVVEEESKAEPDATAQAAARDSYRHHLQERQKLRSKRDEKEQRSELLCRSLYDKWRELRQVRKRMGFTSTPWRLRAQPQHHDLLADTDRRARNLEAETEESAYLQGVAPDQVRTQLENKWDVTKRAPGVQSYRFELSPIEELTSAEILRTRAAGGAEGGAIISDYEAEAAAEELKRRQLVDRVRLCVECRVGERVVGRSPAFRICSDTISTASTAALLEEVPGVSTGAPGALRPIYSFDLAVHVMPRRVSLVVYVSSGGFWRGWYPTMEVEVDIPSLEGRRVTHAAVLDQRLHFGPAFGDVDDKGEEEGIISQSSFSGEVGVCVSWPGGGRDGFVVPPPSLPTGPEGGKASGISGCLPCASGSNSPREQRQSAKLDERLAGLRFDPQDPENAKMLAESPAPKALPGYDTERLLLESSLGRKAKSSSKAGPVRSKRIQKLLQRSEREGVDTERVLVPAFEKEVKDDQEEKIATTDPTSKFADTSHRREFVRRVRERVRKVAAVKSHISYSSIVTEHTSQEGESNYLALLKQFQDLFQPKRTLRPAGTRRKIESKAHTLRIHVAIAKVYDAPLRYQEQLRGSEGAPLPPPPRASGVFGDLPLGVRHDQLPEVVIEMMLEDFQGDILYRRTKRAAMSTDPNINSILELSLQGPVGIELTQEYLQNYGGQLVFNVFDEMTQVLSSNARDVRTRSQLRFLGRFTLPWGTLYASKCTVKGHFRTEQPPVLFGYRPKVEQPRHLVGQSGEALLPRQAPEPRSLCLGLDVTVHPVLVPPTRVQSQVARGKEPNMMLKHVQKWHDSLRTSYDGRLLALGTDMDGRSRLICRFIRPQRPPDHINPGDPFAIERAARYVSLVPFLQDNQMFQDIEDLWCTDQEFLNIQCGDWEEHCILLCNYFNYIDRYRRQAVSGYENADIQSYCVICDLVPEGEAVVVLRRDRHSGHCEFWNAKTGKCYFLPSSSSSWGGFLSFCPRRAEEAEEDVPEVPSPQTSESSLLKASPTIPIRRVYLTFNSDNVWANLQRPSAKNEHKGVSSLRWDLEDRRHWQPLFIHGRDELRRLSGFQPDAKGAYEKLGEDPEQSFHLENPSEALKYELPDKGKATSLESKFEMQLEDDIKRFRAGLTTTDLDRVTNATVFNHVIANRLGELLEQLEELESSRRSSSGSEAGPPLRSRLEARVTLKSVEAFMNEIESDFRMVGRRGGRRSVFGMPFNKPFTDYRDIWDSVRQSRIMELGGDPAEFAVKVKVIPYASGILSVWVFVAVAIDEE
eukprot:TRINITY_DN15896_c0_g1_i1.p1 TRINITY_DN15896_c0_g1~~TRINITY_DN15896_c0_g1_i1.p1  ORF type:complete len:1745 (+),score=308.47 TRINITY_DN15896_c0_g1_i1:250-5235(+)